MSLLLLAVSILNVLQLIRILRPQWRRVFLRMCSRSDPEELAEIPFGLDVGDIELPEGGCFVGDEGEEPSTAGSDRSFAVSGYSRIALLE